MRFCLALLIVGLVLLIGYFILRATGAWEHVNSMEKIRECVENGGVFSSIIFILLQILQTTILQIPAFFVTVAGALIFGRWEAFIMSYIAVMIGSLIMFWIGRRAGRRFLYWMVGKETSEKWIERLSNGKYLFFLMMVFPMFPDDILCVVAGITKMSFPFFFWTNILARGLGIACTVFFGSGAIIPFKGWGLIVWGIIILIVACLFYVSVKYKDKLDELFNQFFAKNKKDKKSKISTASLNVDNIDTNGNNVQNNEDITNKEMGEKESLSLAFKQNKTTKNLDNDKTNKNN